MLVFEETQELAAEDRVIRLPRPYGGPLAARLHLLFPLQQAGNGDGRHLLRVILPFGSSQAAPGVETRDLFIALGRGLPK